MAQPKSPTDEMMDEFYQTTHYDHYGDWRKTPETEEDPDDAKGE